MRSEVRRGRSCNGPWCGGWGDPEAMSTRSEGLTEGRHGWYGIGIERGKTSENLGTLFRSAVCLGAAFVFTVGERYHPQSSDTLKSWRHIPYLRYADVEDLEAHIPYDCPLIGVERSADAQPLETFTHPRRAMYLLGPEDGSLSAAAVDACHQIVRFDSRWCLNVASAGTVVLYDRHAKDVRAKTRFGSSVSVERPSETREVAGSTPARTTALRVVGETPK